MNANNTLHCKDCEYYRSVYIHPCSDESVKTSERDNGYACVLEENVDGTRRVTVAIGKKDLGGCECFTRRKEKQSRSVREKVVLKWQKIEPYKEKTE